METEVDLICARGSIFTFPENLALLILPIPPLIPGHWMAQRIATVSDPSGSIQPQRRTKMAERREGPRETRVQLFFYQNTGVFVPVGSGVHR